MYVYVCSFLGVLLLFCVCVCREVSSATQHTGDHHVPGPVLGAWGHIDSPCPSEAKFTEEKGMYIGKDNKQYGRVYKSA